MDDFYFADLRAPDPLGYEAPKTSNTAAMAAGGCTSSGRCLTNIEPLQVRLIRANWINSIHFAPRWSGLVRVESIHPDQKTRASTGLVRVVRVVRAKSNNIHMRARAYASIFLFFLHIISFLRLKFEFVRNHPDHPDQPNASLHSRPDRRPDQSRTTRTSPVLERVSAFSSFIGGGRRSKTRPKWSGNPHPEASDIG
jgi:hypothetical protein